MAQTLDVSATRSVAFDLLRSVLANRKPFDDALAVHDGMRRLPARDKGFVRLTTATTLRRLGQIDAVIEHCMEKPLPKSGEAVLDIMRLAVAEILFLGVAHHAAVDSAVTLTESRKLGKFKGLVNALLRRLTREGRDLLSRTPIARNFPDWMYEGWVTAYGADVAERIAEASLKEPPLDISVKADPQGWAKKLGAVVLPGGTLRRAFDGAITDLPGFGDGAWWVQDAAASLPALLLGEVAGKRVIDLCAAPGGKTAQLAAAGAVVTAVDRSELRLKRLQRNLVRLQLDAQVIAADALEWRPASPADAVLLDPPCTSTGTIRRHPDILHAKSASDAATLGELQRKLLESAAQMVKPGGRVVFCTCSLQPEEGAAVVEAALAAGAPLKRQPITAAEIGGLKELVTPDGDMRSLPTHLAERGGLDGFFAARLVRTK